MSIENKISQTLAHLNPDLVSEIIESAITKEIPSDQEILKEGQYVKVIPIVIEGLIKVFTSHKDRELLIYYIRPNESCIMSFAASLKNEPSKVFAVTEERTLALLLPVDKVSKWIKQFPDINTLFFQQYSLRYSELLDTIQHLLFNKMDQRLLSYLLEKVNLTKQNPLKLSHRQIANELGTAREVISRTIKKLETEKLVIQHSKSIEIL